MTKLDEVEIGRYANDSDSHVPRPKRHRAPAARVTTRTPVERGRQGQGQRGRARDSLSPVQQRVLARLTEEPKSAAEVFHELDLCQSTIKGALRSLADKGRATRRNSDGRWVRTPESS